MRLNRNLSIILVILFIIVTSYTTVEVISLPSDILFSLEITENAKVERAMNEATPVFIFLGIDLLIVLLIIFTLSTSNATSKVENIVYVEREKSTKDTLQEDSQDEKTLYKKKIKNTEEEVLKLEEVNTAKSLEQIFSIICKELEGSIGALYKAIDNTPKKVSFVTGYAFYIRDSQEVAYEFGEGVVGQVAKSMKSTILKNIPEGYVKITSGLGNSVPRNLLIVPLTDRNEILKGVVEIASFKEFSSLDLDYLKSISNLLIEKLV